MTFIRSSAFSDMLRASHASIRRSCSATHRSIAACIGSNTKPSNNPFADTTSRLVALLSQLLDVFVESLQSRVWIVRSTVYFDDTSNDHSGTWSGCGCILCVEREEEGTERQESVHVDGR